MYHFDELIVSELRKKNPVVLQELYKTHYPMIESMVCLNSGTAQEAKDVYQDAVIAFYERVQENDFVLSCKVKTYIYAVCRRLWLKRLNEKKRFHGKIEETETFLEIESEMTDLEEKEQAFRQMSKALEELGEPCRSILEGFYFNSETMDEIREKFSYTNTDNAKNQKYKCLQRLKKLFFSSNNKESHE